MNAIPKPARPTTLRALEDWVDEVAALTQPDHVHWCDGSQAEADALLARMRADGTLLELNQETHPGCYLHRSDPDDVARVEHLTFVCTPERDDAGPNNHWMAPGTSAGSNPNALATIGRDSIFTNVATTADNQPWWEGLDDREPALDWQGRPYDRANGPAAHPNARFTVSAKQCPSYSPEAENPQGVPISAIVFGGRRASLVPLVFQARDWTHGVLIGASMGSETTAAATGQVGVVRRDPMAMKPFCGYNFADYFAHWLSFDRPGADLPQIFHVNWFRKGSDGKFLWPGFGENLRVLEWIIGRVKGQAGAVETPIGFMPGPDDLQLQDVAMDEQARDALFRVESAGWRAEFDSIGTYLEDYGPRMPRALIEEQRSTRGRLA